MLCHQKNVRSIANASNQKLNVTEQDSKGRKIKSKYGDSQLDAAVKTLKKYPRPWTVSKTINWYTTTTKLNERLAWIRVLAASRNPKAALVLGKALDESGPICIAASYGLHHYFIKNSFYMNTESAIAKAQQWWLANKTQLEKDVQPQ